ncbi:MAG: hypothetical protein ACTHNW_22480 [Mucilaginibacter sp.]
MNLLLNITRRPFTALILLFAVTPCSAQTICNKLHDMKQTYYGFSPHTLSTKQIDAKSAELDKFWNLAKTDKPVAAACLKDMILAEHNDPYFCFDAASLLLSIDEKGQYFDAVSEGMKKCDLNDLQLETYLKMAFYLGTKGQDISKLSEKLISEPNAKVFLTEHVITLNAADASLFLYNKMGTQNAETNLIHTLQNGNTTGRNNAALVLSLLSTAKGDSVLNVAITKKQLPDSIINNIKKEHELIKDQLTKCDGSMSREEVLSGLKAYPGEPNQRYSEIAGDQSLVCSAFKSLKASDADVIRAARDRSTPGLSDEALYDYIVLSEILIYVRGK